MAPEEEGSFLPLPYLQADLEPLLGAGGGLLLSLWSPMWDPPKDFSTSPNPAFSCSAHQHMGKHGIFSLNVQRIPSVRVNWTPVSVKQLGCLNRVAV